MQIPNHRMFIQTRGGVWAITKSCVAKQAMWFVPCLLFYPSLFCFSVLLPVLYQKAQAQLKADVGHCESISSRRQILEIDDSYFVSLHGLHHGDGHLVNGITVLSNQGLLLS